MKFVKSLFACLVIFNAYSIQAEEAAPQEFAQGFISDELFIYMHSGAGNNYRILGSINSGTEIKLTNEEENEYTQIIDTRGRTVWVESKYVSAKPGLRYIIANNSKACLNAGEFTDKHTCQLREVECMFSLSHIPFIKCRPGVIYVTLFSYPIFIFTRSTDPILKLMGDQKRRSS